MLVDSELLELIYPIGSVYITTNSLNPAKMFGGAWTQIKDKFMLSAGDTYAEGATGGEATHALSEAEMPSHKHDVATASSGSATSGQPNDATTGGASTGSSGGASNAITDVEADHSHDSYIKSDMVVGGGANRGFNVTANGLWTATRPSGAHSHTMAHTHAIAHTHEYGHTHINPNHIHTINETSKGSGSAHNNLPPYIAVYVWERTD